MFYVMTACVVISFKSFIGTGWVVTKDNKIFPIFRSFLQPKPMEHHYTPDCTNLGSCKFNCSGPYLCSTNAEWASSGEWEFYWVVNLSFLPCVF